jgi:hypothetical protein
MMTNRFRIRHMTICSLTVVGVFIVAAGCTHVEQSPTAKASDPDDVPITEADIDMPANYADAVTRIGQCRDQIRDAIAEGSYGKAHRPLDELEIVLWKMPNIARDSGIPKSSWETVVVSSEKLSELFSQVHAAIDDHQEPNYDAVAQPIDEALDRLEEISLRYRYRC